MSVQRTDGRLYVKGAAEALLPLCVRGTEGALEASMALSGRGLRVLAVAVGENRDEEQLTLLGLIGMADPPDRKRSKLWPRRAGPGLRRS